MVFNNNFIAVVKSNGRILRECNGEVRLPFGSEYSILLKNKDSRKAVVKISVDGKSVTDGRIIVDAFSDVELTGFLEGFSVRNRFRFIKKTEEIAEHLGDNIDDGIVTVEYWFERKVYETYRWSYTKEFKWPPDPYISYCSQQEPLNQVFCCSSSVSRPEEVGITVKGSETRQDFVSGNVNSLESQSSVINIILRGYSGSGNVVKKAVTVSDKVKCPTCGRSMKSSVKYCSNCGTYLL